MINCDFCVNQAGNVLTTSGFFWNQSQQKRSFEPSELFNKRGRPPNGAQRVNRNFSDLRALSTKIWGWLHVMQITIQRNCPAWPQSQNCERL